jgi:hypothetical protein
MDFTATGSFTRRVHGGSRLIRQFVRYAKIRVKEFSLGRRSAFGIGLGLGARVNLAT